MCSYGSSYEGCGDIVQLVADWREKGKGLRETERLAKEVKEFAVRSGADLVGIVSAATIDALPPVWVGWTIREYTGKTTDTMPDAKSIIVVGYNVWDEMLETAIRKDGGWVYPGYFPLTTITLRVARFLETGGFKTALSFTGSYKRLAQLAGFGNYGKNSLIINPVYGPWIRLAPILTNAEIIADKPFETDLCGECDACIKACPMGALSPYRVDDAKCLVGLHLNDLGGSRYVEAIRRFEPALSRCSHLMCMECQKACRYGKRG